MVPSQPTLPGDRSFQNRGGRFPKRLRILTPRQFKVVYEARIRKSAGPVLVYGRPNQLPFTRIGLSVSRSAGSAVVRNGIKRRLREAFRLIRVHAPSGYDFVISVRVPHRLRLEAYQELLMRAFLQIDDTWRKKSDQPKGT